MLADFEDSPTYSRGQNVSRGTSAKVEQEQKIGDLTVTGKQSEHVYRSQTKVEEPMVVILKVV